MAKAQVLKHLGECQYQIQLKYAVERVLAEKTRVETRLAELAVEVPTSKTDVLAKEAEMAAVEAAIDDLIPAYRAGTEGAKQQITEKQVALIKLRGELTQMAYHRDLLIAENLALLKRRNQIDRIPEDKTLNAWCADFTTDLSGVVGVADINDEGGQGVIIQPGYDGSAGWNAARDGVLMPREAQSGPQLFFNAAILPGVQKWQPRYRVATISNIKSDTCTITLDPATSSAQALNINAEEVYASVPIEYMDCNADAFEEGDSVLVRFTQSGPLVVGFESEPRECDVGDFAFIPAQYSATEGLESFGLPEVGGSSLGTRNGTSPAWFFRENRAGAWDFRKYREPNYGAQDWTGPDDLVLSWRGNPGRVTFGVARDTTLGAYFNRTPKLYCNGNEVADASSVVSGAMVYGAGVAGNTLTVICKTEFSWSVIQYPWQGRGTTGPGSLVDTFATEPDYWDCTGWYFNKAGTQAIITLRATREKVATKKYIVGSGPQALNVIWERGYETTGTLTTNYTGPGPLNDTENYTRITQQHDIPIYVDFVGDVETTLSLRRSEYVLQVDNNNVNSTYQEVESQSSFSFVLSTGATLATIGPIKDRTWYLSNSGNSFSSTRSSNSRFPTLENSFFDIRSKCVMLEILENTYQRSYSGTVSNENPTVPGSESTRTATVYEMYVDGQQILQKSTQLVDYTQEGQGAYEEVPDAIGGEQGSILGPLGPSLFHDKHLVNVGYQAAKGQAIATLFVRVPAGLSVTGEEETVFENQITGFADPELQLFDGKSNMTLYALGRL